MAETEFSTHICNQYLTNVKKLFAVCLRTKQTTFSMEILSFSLKIVADLFMGNPTFRLFKVFGLTEGQRQTYILPPAAGDN